MGFYNVLEPCVVGKLHYATVPVQPIEVDDEVAAPLVESGSLKAYQPGHDDHVHVAVGGSVDGPVFVVPTLGIGFAEPVEVQVEPEKPPRPRAPRRAKD